MTDPAAPTTPEPYGVPETIAHWRRQADLCDSDVESATFIHCADEIEEALAHAEARSTPAEALDATMSLAHWLCHGPDDKHTGDSTPCMPHCHMAREFVARLRSPESDR